MICQNIFARLLRSGEADDRDLENLIQYLEWLKRSDSHSFKKHNRRIQRFLDAHAITERLYDLIDGGMSRAKAMETLAREHRPRRVVQVGFRGNPAREAKARTAPRLHRKRDVFEHGEAGQNRSDLE